MVTGHGQSDFFFSFFMCVFLGGLECSYCGHTILCPMSEEIKGMADVNDPVISTQHLPPRFSLINDSVSL